MRRTLGSIGAWMVATSIGILVAWLGVRSVQFAAVPDQIEPLSAAAARRLAPRAATVSTSPNEAANRSASPTSTASARPKPKVTKPRPSPSLVDDGWQQVPDGRGGSAVQRTFVVKGGAATIRFAQGDVKITATAPAPGFGVAIDGSRPDVAIVTFMSNGHFSRLEGTWENGARVKTTEGGT